MCKCREDISKVIHVDHTWRSNACLLQKWLALNVMEEREEDLRLALWMTPLVAWRGMMYFCECSTPWTVKLFLFFLFCFSNTECYSPILCHECMQVKWQDFRKRKGLLSCLKDNDGYIFFLNSQNWLISIVSCVIYLKNAVYWAMALPCVNQMENIVMKRQVHFVFGMSASFFFILMS